VSEIAVRDTEPMDVAYLPMTGPYKQTPEGYGKLYGWVAQHGLQAEGMPASVYLTMPSEVPEEQARWELWAPLAGNPEEAAVDASGVGIKHVPRMHVVASMHRGPYETIAPTYEAVWAFMDSHDFLPAGPPMERYYSDPDEVPPAEYLTEVVVPVRPK